MRYYLYYLYFVTNRNPTFIASSTRPSSLPGDLPFVPGPHMNDRLGIRFFGGGAINFSSPRSPWDRRSVFFFAEWRDRRSPLPDSTAPFFVHTPDGEPTLYGLGRIGRGVRTFGLVSSSGKALLVFFQ